MSILEAQTQLLDTVRQRIFEKHGKEKYWCDRCEKSSALTLNNCCDFCGRPWRNCPDCGKEPEESYLSTVLRPYYTPEGNSHYICPDFCNSGITTLAYLSQEYWKEVGKEKPSIIEHGTDLDNLNRHIGLYRDGPSPEWPGMKSDFHYVPACGEEGVFILYKPLPGDPNCQACIDAVPNPVPQAEEAAS